MYLSSQPFHIEHIPRCRRADQSNIIASPILNGEHARRGHVRKPDCCLRPVAECASTHRLRGNCHRALRDCGSFPVAGRRASTAVLGNRPGTGTCSKDGFPESSSVVTRQDCDEPAAVGEFVQRASNSRFLTLVVRDEGITRRRGGSIESPPSYRVTLTRLNRHELVTHHTRHSQRMSKELLPRISPMQEAQQNR
jgi:hypothetical protein